MYIIFILNFILKFVSNTFLDFINDNSVKKSFIIQYKDKNDNKDDKNRINELEKYVKELEAKLEEKDKKINEEKIKIDNLNKRIKELERISKKDPQINNIIKLEDEIKLFKKYNNFSEGEKLISIKFISDEKDIDYSIVAKNTEKFSKIETLIYDKYPKYIESENNYFVGGNKINRNKTLEQNNINHDDTITLKKSNFE